MRTVCCLSILTTERVLPEFLGSKKGRGEDEGNALVLFISNMVGNNNIVCLIVVNFLSVVPQHQLNYYFTHRWLAIETCHVSKVEVPDFG